MDVAKGMKLTDAFSTPMFTPSTKAEAGHDVNISVDRASLLVGADRLHQAQELASTSSAEPRMPWRAWASSWPTPSSNSVS